MNLYVGNLSFETNEAELKTAFVAFGQVGSVTIIRDKFSGDSARRWTQPRWPRLVVSQPGPLSGRICQAQEQ